MAHESESEVIRQQMELQRAALSDKLETLESKIVDTVEGAREAVAETVETVKTGVQDSVHAVRDSVHTSMHAVQDTFDIPRQVERRPWTMFAGAIAAGFAAGYILNRAGRAPVASGPIVRTHGEPAVAPAPPHSATRWGPITAARGAEATGGGGESWAKHLTELFGPEIHKIKGLALGAVMGVVREMVIDPLPDQMRPQVKDIVDNITTKLGGELVSSEAVEPLVPRRHDDHHNGHHAVEQAAGPLGRDRPEFGN
jgi:ElaB/YqjD/DUF883 family membrane-anchored ribosome-binding protein